MKYLKNIDISLAVSLIIVRMNNFQLVFFLWIFHFDLEVKPHNKIVFYCFLYCINVCLKLITYFVTTGFNNILDHTFFVINLYEIHWFLFILVNLCIIKLIFWHNYWFLGNGFFMKHNQNKTMFLMSYNSSSFNDMKFLAYGVSRR